jgi:hypothetical protein
MDKKDNEQIASPATAESPSSTLESNQQRWIIVYWKVFLTFVSLSLA